ncbi:trypsin-like peptidase domain-containing protein [Streptomyces sp. AN091965]|uniref:trypsin-like peptidase domain-containing protein n=1 Tax=Streptomyces sp. AN091965 TaxID=2927803 RepID=UPI001F61D3BF|nr:trypsin-like peptidase domain-containing protein [Streptomyces sp. AN091965]MCI3928527.1 trypsin-like peptidase domain-containing protein [Streptomyces sp. AN091965]
MGKAPDPVIRAASTGWEGLLKAATVRLQPPSGEVGTGFVVARGLVVTCAHVVAEREDLLPARVRGRVVALGRELRLEPVRDSYVRDRESGLDLVLLRITDRPRTSDADLPPVLASGVVEIGDDLWTYGHPVGGFHAGQSTNLRYQGTDLRSEEPDAPWLPRAEGLVGAGCSGSAVINVRTGAVCGMVSTSDLSGSVHLVPVEQILARCPAGTERAALGGEWPRALTESQLEAAGWRYLTPRLREYLTTAADSADAEHPYPAIEGKAPSSLSIVYVRRYADEASRDEEPEAGADGADQQSADGERKGEAQGHDGTGEPSGERRPRQQDGERILAEALFELDEDVLLVGAPGAGKSSLLRHAVAELADRWGEEGSRPGVIPVRMDAKEFKGDVQPLAAIAAAADGVTAPSAAGWPPHWFDGPPLPAVRWLILVDGLDEAGGPEARATVLRKIGEVRAGSVGDDYRFLVTTRPLPSEEGDPADLRRFDLLPLDSAQLPEFAQRWFTALELDDPCAVKDRFMDRLSASGMAEPARTPLMASMLCQLFAMDQRKPLPRGRSAVYRAFVDAILDDRRWVRSRTMHPRIEEEAESRCGPHGVTALKAVRAGLPDDIERLALERYEGDKRPAVDLLTAWHATPCPAEADPGRGRWAGLLAYALPEFLRDSGLLVQRRQDFVFIHQTFAEFLTAKRIAHSAERSQAEFRRLFGHGPRWPAWAVWLTRTAEPAGDSIARFLIDAWGHKRQRGLQQALCRLATGPDGAKLIATLVADGAEVDAAAQRSATAVLHGKAQLGDHEAAVALARMGDARGVGILTTMADQSRHVSGQQLNAAMALADLGDGHGPRVLRALAEDPAHPDTVRAAEELIRRDDPCGARALLAHATRPGTPSRVWSSAAQALVALRLPEGIAALRARMADTGEPAATRIAVARVLTDVCAPQVAETMAELIRDDLPLDVRGRALALLRTLAHFTPRATALLTVVAAEPGLPAELRIEAAGYLPNRTEQERVLLAAAENPATSTELRLKALSRVPGTTPLRAVRILLPVIADPTVPVRTRFDAVQRLPPSPSPREESQRALASLLADPSLPSDQCASLVRYLAFWWTEQHRTLREERKPSTWWCDTVCALVLDGTTLDAERRELIEELTQARAWSTLTALASSATLPGALRRLAARAAKQTHPADDVPDPRLKLAWDATVKPLHRLAALFEVLWELAVPLALDLALHLRDLAHAVTEGIERLLYWLLQLVFVALLAVLPVSVAVTANAFSAVCAADHPPEDWKLRVYLLTTALLVSTVYIGATSVADTGRTGREILLLSLPVAAVLGFMRAPEPPVLNEMGSYLAAVIPWNGELRA